jgi:hypothetical protein
MGKASVSAPPAPPVPEAPPSLPASPAGRQVAGAGLMVSLSPPQPAIPTQRLRKSAEDHFGSNRPRGAPERVLPSLKVSAENPEPADNGAVREAALEVKAPAAIRPKVESDDEMAFNMFSS